MRPLEPANSPYAIAKLTAIEIGDSLRKQYGMDIVNLMPAIFMVLMIILQKNIVM